jgi:hypothetical protein
MKAIYLLFVLFLGTTVFAQEKWKEYSDYVVRFEHSNGVLSNSKLKISLLSDFEPSNTVDVYYEIKGEQFSKKISLELFIEIVDDIKKIPVFDLIKYRNTFSLDVGTTTLSIQDMLNEIRLNITGIYDVEEYKEAASAVLKILKIIDLDLKALR